MVESADRYRVVYSTKTSSHCRWTRTIDDSNEDGAELTARSVTTNLAVFAVAAFFEIAGCFAFWMWLRRGVTPFIALLGIASLIGFAVALTRVDSAFAGRAYAAYGGVYIAASLVWLWAAEGQRPTVTDLIGATLAMIGALVIIGFASRTN